MARPKRLTITRETLHELYWNKEFSLQKIGDKLGCDGSNIRYWMKKYKIPRRSCQEATMMFIAVKPNLDPSPELAYVLGVLLGDGSTSYNVKKHRYHISLCVKSKAFPESFKNALEKIGLHPSPICYSKTRVFCAVATSKLFVEWFRGLTLKDIEKIVSAKEEYQRSFARGFYESDGFLEKYACVICNTNKELLVLAKKVLTSLTFTLRLRGPYITGHKKPYYMLATLGGRPEKQRFIETIQPCIKTH